MSRQTCRTNIGIVENTWLPGARTLDAHEALPYAAYKFVNIEAFDAHCPARCERARECAGARHTDEWEGRSCNAESHRHEPRRVRSARAEIGAKTAITRIENTRRHTAGMDLAIQRNPNLKFVAANNLGSPPPASRHASSLRVATPLYPHSDALLRNWGQLRMASVRNGHQSAVALACALARSH